MIHNGTDGDIIERDFRYSITGLAWNDSNANGARDEDEGFISGIEVMLVNKNGSLVLDEDTKEKKIVKTNANGIYTFSNLVPGEYAVIFLYDVARYNITDYHKSDVDEALNCDALNVDLTIDGEARKAGTTAMLKLTNKNIRNIDIGLYTAEKFDLSLTKYISKIVRMTPTSGTTTYEYNKNVAKVEVLGSNLGKASVIIEYKIVVKNEGAISGYAKKIVDYLPSSLSFNSELNPDWFLANDGNVYSTKLADVEIKPGEQKELTLIVMKTITENSLGIISNNAEIYESYNTKGLEDYNSKAGNKVQKENDMSSADVILSLVTGTIIKYTIITLSVIALLAGGIIFIKRRVLENKGRR